nr:type II toxin-antitoxin system prevent-host-death family antitoxin [uncultured Deefgea sp.]
MEAMTYTYTRQHFAEVMDRVNDDHSPVVITRQQGRPVVMISLDDYHAMEETAYLLRNPNGAKRLMDSVQRLRAGQGEIKELIDADQV